MVCSCAPLCQNISHSGPWYYSWIWSSPYSSKIGYHRWEMKLWLLLFSFENCLIITLFVLYWEVYFKILVWNNLERMGVTEKVITLLIYLEEQLTQKNLHVSNDKSAWIFWIIEVLSQCLLFFRHWIHQ